jgi:hypothetical protein
MRTIHVTADGRVEGDVPETVHEGEDVRRRPNPDPPCTVLLLREGQRIAHLSPAEGIALRAEVGYLRELKADHGLDRVVVEVDDAYLGRDQLRRVGDVATELRLPIDIHLLRDE